MAKVYVTANYIWRSVFDLSPLSGPPGWTFFPRFSFRQWCAL